MLNAICHRMEDQEHTDVLLVHTVLGEPRQDRSPLRRPPYPRGRDRSHGNGAVGDAAPRQDQNLLVSWTPRSEFNASTG